MVLRCKFLVLALCLFLPNRVPAPILSGPIMRTIGGSSSTLNTGLIAYWKLDETSGTRVDSGSNGQDLTDNNTVTSNTGIISNAAQFVAANSEYLNRADNSTLSTGDIDFSIAIWVKYTATAGNQSAISRDNSSTQREYNLFLATTALNFYVFNSAGTSKVAGPHTVSAGTWYHVVCWVDATADTVNMRINDTTTYSTSTAAFAVNDSTAEFRIGAWQAGGAYLGGLVDEVGFWKKVLSAAEITELFNSGSGRTCCPF